MYSVHRKRNREGPNDDREGEQNRRRIEEQQPQQPHQPHQPALPEGVIAVGAMNNKSRIFVPGKENYFAGIQCEYVMIDNGCNSLLLPFPQDRSVLDQFMTPMFSWKVSHLTGTGAIRSPTLTIKHKLNLPIGSMELTLAKGPFDLPRLRFHVDKDTARYLHELGGTDLDDNDRTRLESFLDALGENDSVQRRHALLGQLFLKDRMCIQSDPVFLLTEKNYGGPIQEALARVVGIVEPMLESFEEFHDLEDDDHDGDDNEEKRRSWGSDEDIDEPNC